MARNTPQPPISRTLRKILLFLLAALYIADAALNPTLANTSKAHGATVPESPSPTPPVDTPYSYKAALDRFPIATLLDTFEPRISQIIARALIPDSPITSANTALLVHRQWNIEKLVDRGMLRPMASGVPEAIDAALGNVRCVKLIVMRRGWSARDQEYVEKQMRNLLGIMEWLEGESEIGGSGREGGVSGGEKTVR